MPKYSVIVPVYNVEKYLEKCLLSIENQTFEDYEVIAVNDGSTDNSLNMLNEFTKRYDNIKIISQNNQGLSSARNTGLTVAQGEYIIFVDSDDYVKEDLLETIDSNIHDNTILRFQIITVVNNIEKVYNEIPFETINGKDAFKIITNYHFVEPACCYVYKKDYLTSNNLYFKENRIHEDFGIIPYAIYNAPKVKSIAYAGYYYVIRDNSIMTNTNYEKTKKKVYDMYEQYMEIKQLVPDAKNNYMLSYMANSVIVKARELNKQDRKEYFKQLKNNHVYNDILTDTFSRKIKKIILLINYNLYLKVVK